MTNITTDRKFNFTKAENDIFSWNDSYGDFLYHKASGRSVYQMRWTDTKQTVDSDTREQVTAFWNELAALKRQPQRNEPSDDDILEILQGKALMARMDDPDSDL